MEPFTITSQRLIYKVYPQQDGSFLITDGKERYMQIFPEANIEIGINWATGDLITAETVEKIGELIEQHYL